MAGYVYNPAEFKKFPVTCVDKDGKETVYQLPLVGYVLPEVTDHVDALMVERIEEVQKVRDARNANRQPIIDADPSQQYPTRLDSVVWMIEEIEPALAVEIKSWPYGAREEFWQSWQEASKITVGKSESSNDSSDETE